jgi:hypothetical protein
MTEKQPKQADILIEIADDAALLFHAPNGTPYADVEVNGHSETWAIRTKGFKRWLVQRFFLMTGKAPGSEALHAALNVVEAKAHFDGPEHVVGLRVSGLNDKLYLDLGDEHWRAVEIDADGWRIVDRPPARFRRASGMMPLPMPKHGGSIETLKQLLNVQSEEQFILTVSWLLAALRNCGPYPILALSGEQGSTKSTFSKLVRSLVDPNAAPLRALPREDRDLFIAANNGHALAFDNVSGLPFWISDTICRLATGGGFSIRQLYTDQDEILFDAQRPVILNGIEDIVERPDLADRSIFLTLQSLPKTKRLPEQQVLTKFEVARPDILGGLLDAMVLGLKRLPGIELQELPRMADFAQFITACEAALWKKGTFITAYTGNIEEATKTLIEGDIVADAVLEFMAERQEWTGSAKDLLGALDCQVGDAWVKKKKWPKAPKSLSGSLTRLAPSFRRIGLEISRLKREESMRPIHLEWVGRRPSFSSASSGTAHVPYSSMTVADETSLSAVDHNDGFVSRKSPKANGHDTPDATDGQKPSYSGSPDDDPFTPLRDSQRVLQPNRRKEAASD